MSPGSINTIPAALELYVDLEHRDMERLPEMEVHALGSLALNWRMSVNAGPPGSFDVSNLFDC